MFFTQIPQINNKNRRITLYNLCCIKWSSIIKEWDAKFMILKSVIWSITLKILSFFQIAKFPSISSNLPNFTQISSNLPKFPPISFISWSRNLLVTHFRENAIGIFNFYSHVFLIGQTKHLKVPLCIGHVIMLKLRSWGLDCFKVDSFSSA